jgi:large subunit ribosomal protein L24
MSNINQKKESVQAVMVVKQVKRVSSLPRKQRKARYNAALHQKQTFAHVALSKDLRARHSVKNIQVRKGDTVKILRGQFKRKQGKVEKVDLKRERVLIEGAHKEKKDGSKNYYPIHPSNIQIISLELSDSKRKKKVQSKKQVQSKAEAQPKIAKSIEGETK